MGRIAQEQRLLITNKIRLLTVSYQCAVDFDSHFFIHFKFAYILLVQLMRPFHLRTTCTVDVSMTCIIYQNSFSEVGCIYFKFE